MESLGSFTCDVINEEGVAKVISPVAGTVEGGVNTGPVGSVGGGKVGGPPISVEGGVGGTPPGCELSQSLRLRESCEMKQSPVVAGSVTM